MAAQSITSAPETDVFDISSDDTFLYKELSIFLNNLLFHSRNGKYETTLLTVANISHHTLQRILERELTTPERLCDEVTQILMIARALAHYLDQTSLDPEKTWNLLIPYRDGAFQARTLRMHPSVRDYYQGKRPILSLRTYLDDNKLSDEDRERMAGFKISKEAYISTADFQHTKRWIEGNAQLHLQRN